MPVSLSPLFNATQLFDNNGSMLAGGMIYFYQAGSFSVLSPLYTSSTGTIARANPVVLSSSGRVPGEVWIDSALTYNVVLTQADGVTVIQNWDNVSTNAVAGVGSVAGILAGTGISTSSTSGIVTINSTVSEWLPELAAPTFISGVQFSVPGNLVSTYAVGRRIKATVTAGTAYGTITASAYTTLTTVTVVMDNIALDSGLSAVEYGFSNYLSQPGGLGSTPISLTSATTTNIGAAATSSVFLSGATTINAFDNVNAGTLRYVTFNSAIIITYNPTSMILLGGINKSYQVGDTSLFLSLGGGNWKELTYSSFASGSSIITSTRQGLVYSPIDMNGDSCFLEAGATTGLAITSKNIVSPVSVASTVSTPIASPGITTWTAHGLSAGQGVVYSTTGALPTGLTAGVTYYVLSAGLGTNVFEVAAAPGGTAINFTGTTSGVSSAATVPQNEISSVVTTPIASPGVVNWSGHTLVSKQAVQFSVSAGGALPTGLVAGTTYYVSATGLLANSFQVSATPGGAVINFTGTTSGTVTCLAGYRSNLLVSAFAPTTVVGDNNVVGATTSNLTWTGLVDGYTNYLYVLVSSNGGLVTGSTIIPPSTVSGAINPGTLLGQITIDNLYNNVYLGDGTSAIKTSLVVVGTAIASGGNITSTTSYSIKTSTIPTGGLIKKTLLTTSGIFVPNTKTRSLEFKVIGGGGAGGSTALSAHGGASGGNASVPVDGYLNPVQSPILASNVTTAIASPGLVGWTAHTLAVNTPVVFATTGTLPTGLVAGTTYYVSAAGLTPNSFEVSATIGGAAINFTGTTTGISSCFSIPYQFVYTVGAGSGSSTFAGLTSGAGTAGQGGTNLSVPAGFPDFFNNYTVPPVLGGGTKGLLYGPATNNMNGFPGQVGTGGNGGFGDFTSGTGAGGGGGGAACTYYVSGAGGNGGNGGLASAAGGAATAYGAGGGGSGGNMGYGAGTGGAGGHGLIIVWEYA